MLRLWEYVSGELIGIRSSNRDARIVPARGTRFLYAANEVVRVGERRNLKAEDWEFLSPHFLAMDLNWTRFLNQQRQEGETSGDEVLKGQVQLGSQLYFSIGAG